MLHNIFLQDSMLKEAEIIWIGDSIIANMALSQYWRDFIEPLHPLNFGIGGDQTQNVLWRIQQKELTHSKAKHTERHTDEVHSTEVEQQTDVTHDGTLRRPHQSRRMADFIPNGDSDTNSCFGETENVNKPNIQLGLGEEIGAKDQDNVKLVTEEED
uniref:Uncharacterized protein n=1 Tax=Timema douglasi TaxID=61478 RepID=A0A7R8VT64_TIMDO|nr:unnamed protein product [Timema douglasi]